MAVLSVVEHQVNELLSCKSISFKYNKENKSKINTHNVCGQHLMDFYTMFIYKSKTKKERLNCEMLNGF